MDEPVPLRTHLDLFSGIGGFALAAGWAGFETVQFVEIDPFCRKVLGKHWPHVPIHDDIRTFAGGSVGRPIDLLTGGFPCQPTSLAGQRRGSDDDRWLWPEMRRIIAGMRPRWVCAENPPGLLSMGFDDCLSDLEAIGYTTASVVLPAGALGAWHRRDRVWILAHAQGVLGEAIKRSEPNGTLSGDGSVPADASRQCLDREGQAWHGRAELADGARWSSEPPLGRVVHGIPGRVDRLRALGNAIVPQVAYEIIRLMG